MKWQGLNRGFSEDLLAFREWGGGWAQTGLPVEKYELHEPANLLKTLFKPSHCHGSWVSGLYLDGHGGVNMVLDCVCWEGAVEVLVVLLHDKASGSSPTPWSAADLLRNSLKPCSHLHAHPDTILIPKTHEAVRFLAVFQGICWHSEIVGGII